MKLIKTDLSDPCGVWMGSGGKFIIGSDDIRVESHDDDDYFYCQRPATYKTIAPGYDDVDLTRTLLAGSDRWEPDVIEVWTCD